MERMKFAEMLNRALKDTAFATLVASNPSAALKEAGIDATPERVDALRMATEAMLKAMATIDWQGERTV